MAPITIRGAVNDPGTPGKSGDDRYGFDEQQGTAWAFDGATDVTDLRPFGKTESGAAWIAQAYSDHFISHPAPDGALDAYWQDVFQAVRGRAEKETKIPLETLPAFARPVAAGVWARVRAGQTTICWLGDCLALIDTGTGAPATIGSPDKAETETAEARRLNAMSAEDRLSELQAQRTGANKNGSWLFGLVPAAAAHVNSATRDTPPGTEILLMTDGFYRLVSPYELHDAASLFALVRENGLLGAIAALRQEEATGASKSAETRIKRRDDACCVWLRVDA